MVMQKRGLRGHHPGEYFDNFESIAAEDSIGFCQGRSCQSPDFLENTLKNPVV
jgi:hypothetical protein